MSCCLLVVCLSVGWTIKVQVSPRVTRLDQDVCRVTQDSDVFIDVKNNKTCFMNVKLV